MNDVPVDQFISLTGMTREEADKEVKRIFDSFPKEFKQASVQLLRHKVLQRIKVISTRLPDSSSIEILELAWAEVALEMLMIMTDALGKSALTLQETEEKLKVVSHLMPSTSSRKQ